jgi:hypothetical protein
MAEMGYAEFSNTLNILWRSSKKLQMNPLASARAPISMVFIYLPSSFATMRGIFVIFGFRTVFESITRPITTMLAFNVTW